MPPSHLVTVWNPHYAPEAMDQQLGVLLDWARRRAAPLSHPATTLRPGRRVRVGARRNEEVP